MKKVVKQKAPKISESWAGDKLLASIEGLHELLEPQARLANASLEKEKYPAARWHNFARKFDHYELLAEPIFNYKPDETIPSVDTLALIASNLVGHQNETDELVLQRALKLWEASLAMVSKLRDEKSDAFDAEILKDIEKQQGELMVVAAYDELNLYKINPGDEFTLKEIIEKLFPELDAKVVEGKILHAIEYFPVLWIDRATRWKKKPRSLNSDKIPWREWIDVIASMMHHEKKMEYTEKARLRMQEESEKETRRVEQYSAAFKHTSRRKKK